MRKVLLTVAIGLFIISCTNTKKGNEDTLSGLIPSQFEQEIETGKLNQLYVLKNTSGMEISVTNRGARLVSVTVPDKAGNSVNVLAGYDNIEPYVQLTDYTGAVLGRYAGRLSGEINIDRVTYRLRTNEGDIMLNGGPRGFSTQHFNIEKIGENSLVCNYVSSDKEEGFSGNLDLTVTYTLTNNNALEIKYEAFTSQATFFNVTNQLQFNLSGITSNSLSDQTLFIDASSYVEMADNKLPTGQILPVTGDFGFTTPKAIKGDKPYDVMYALNKPGAKDNKAAQLISSTTGIRMEVYTTEPGIQLNTSTEKPFVTIQTQHFPDSPHQPAFPSTVLRADSTFYSQTIYQFSIAN